MNPTIARKSPTYDYENVPIWQESEGKALLTFKVIVDEPTRTIKVRFGEAKIEEFSLSQF